MRLFDWFKSNPSCKRFDDAFALNRPALWKAIKQTIDSPLQANKPIWLVTHFLDTYSALQDQLDQWQVDYEIVSQPIDPSQLERTGLLSDSTIKLVLAQLIPESDPQYLESDYSQTLVMIVVERHPQLLHDQKIDSFAQSAPVRVEYGYFLSLEDDVVKLIVNETSLKVLKQLGMNEHELITSHMVTSRLNKVLGRMSETFVSDHPADSAKQWLEENSKPPA